MTTRRCPGHELPQFWELATKKREQMHPGTEDCLYLKQPRCCCWDRCWPNWRWLLGTTVLFLHAAHPPRPPSIRALLVRSGEWAVGQTFPLTIAGSANLPFNHSGLFMGFWAVSSQTHHTHNFGNDVMLDKLFQIYFGLRCVFITARRLSLIGFSLAVVRGLLIAVDSLM